MGEIRVKRNGAPHAKQEEVRYRYIVVQVPSCTSRSNQERQSVIGTTVEQQGALYKQSTHANQVA